MIIDQWTQAANRAALFEGMSRVEIEGMSVGEYARRTGRPAPAESAIATLDAQYSTSVPEGQEQPHAVVQEPQQPPEGIDPNSDEAFHAWRAGRARGGEGAGIFDSVPSRSAEYTAAVRAQSGRTGWNQSNVVEPPRLDGRYVRQGDGLDTRSAGARFSTPGNANSF